MPPVSTTQPGSSASPRRPRSLAANASAEAGCPCTAAPVAESATCPSTSSRHASIPRSSDEAATATGPIVKNADDALSATTSGKVNRKSRNRLSITSMPQYTAETAASALAAVESVYGGIEVIDSRYRDFRFTLPDVVADNASSGCFVTGPVAASPAALDLGLEACLLELNGQVVDSATGAAVQGHPAEALALAANDLGRRGLAIEPGWIVLTGGMTDAVAVPAGAVLAAHFTHLGSLFLL